MTIEETIEAIRAAHRERCFWMEQRKRTNLSLGSHLRTVLGWRLDLPEAERSAIRKQATDLATRGERYVKAVERAAQKTDPDKQVAALAALADPELGRHRQIILGAIEMRRKIDEGEEAATEAMEALAATLPAYAFAGACRGFGALGLAIVVGEAGDLGNYATKSKLYKRLGLAVIGAVRQGCLSKTASAQQWIDHGYSAKRRSRIWTLGIAVLMSGNERYRAIYLDRKAYERARAEAEGLTVAPASAIPKKREVEYRSLGHIDNRARRYMEKRLLCDLWRAWRRLQRSSAGVDQAIPAPFEGQSIDVPPADEQRSTAGEGHLALGLREAPGHDAPPAVDLDAAD